MRRSATAVGTLAITAILGLAGCSSGSMTDVYTNAMSNVRGMSAASATSTTAAEPTPPPEPAPAPATQAPVNPVPPPTQAQQPTAGTTACSTDGHAAIESAMEKIAPPLPGSSWDFEGATNYNTCNDLSYAQLETSGGTGSSPMQLLMFHRGKFVGTGIKCNLPFQKVTSASADSVDADYHYLQGSDDDADPSGTFHLTFSWSGGGVQMSGSIPKEAVPPGCS